MKKLPVVVVIITIFAAVALYLAGNYTTQKSNQITKEIVQEVQEQKDGEVYTDTEFGYSIFLPKGLKVESQGKYSKLFLPDTEVTGVGPANFIYISVVTPEMRVNTGDIYNYSPPHFQKLIALENIGDSVNLAEGDVPNLGEWFTYTVVAIESIDTGTVKNFENTKPWEFPAGTTENRFIYGTEKNIYILGYYTGGDSVAENSRIDPRIAYQVIKSFKPSR